MTLGELAPIGLFDSGIGGLTLMRHLIDEMPEESIIYLADNARMPYGDRSVEELIEISLENGRYLEEMGCKMVVVACNTSSSVALKALSSELSIPVIGVVEMAAKVASKESKTGHIGVIGTSRTVQSGSYEREIKRWRPDALVTSSACPNIVPIVEKNVNGAQIADIAPHILPLITHTIDTLILGCTHFPLIRSQIETLLGEKINIIDSSKTTISQIKDRLIRMGMKAPKHSVGNYRFFTTGATSPFKESASTILGRPVLIVYPTPTSLPITS